MIWSRFEYHTKNENWKLDFSPFYLSRALVAVCDYKNSSLEYIRSSSMVAEKNPPKPEVVSDDDGDDEDVQERQEIVRENQILRQGTFLLLFWKSVAFFCPHLFTFIFLANEEIGREIDATVDELVQLEQDIVQHEQELYIQEEQLIAMIYQQRENRLALHSTRDATLRSEAEKNDSGNGSGDSSKK